MTPGQQSREKHITSDLEAEIQREVMQLEAALRADSMDDRPVACSVLSARVHALKWVLTRSAAAL